MQFALEIKQSVIKAVQKCAAEIKQILSDAQGRHDEEADLLEGVSDILVDKRIEDYAAYKEQQIIRDHEPIYKV